MKLRPVRQGDVALWPAESIPANARPVEPKGRIALAWGEATGHVHCIHEEAGTYDIKTESGAVESVTVAGGSAVSSIGPDGTVYLRIEGEVALLHTDGLAAPGAAPARADHDGIVLTTGVYEYVPQREYSPESIQSVRD